MAFLPFSAEEVPFELSNCPAPSRMKTNPFGYVGDEPLALIPCVSACMLLSLCDKSLVGFSAASLAATLLASIEHAY